MNKFTNNFEISSRVVVIFFTIYLILGLLIVPDYGISWDESAERMHGFIAGNYILEKILPFDLYTKILNETISSRFSELKDIEVPKLMEHGDKAYGVFLELPLAFLELLFQFNETKDVYLFRHYVNFLIFFTSVIFFYKYLNLFFENKFLSLLGCLFLILSPRIFAQSFYNSKDIIFLSFFIISNYYGFLLLKNKNLASAFFFAFSVSALVSFRIIGLIVPILFLILLSFEYFYLKKKFNFFKLFLITFSFFILITYFTWPFLWEDPLNNFFFTINHFATRAQAVYMLYLGNTVDSTNLPWHYLIVWIIVTSPTHLIFFSFIGMILFLYNFFLINKNFKNILFFHIFLILVIYLIVPLLITIILEPHIYSGWRHFYFLLPFLILFSILALKIIFFSFNKTYIKLLTLFILLISIFYNFVWNFNNHPYQYTYFNNIFFNKKTINYFERDYWGVSNKDLIDHVAEIDKSEKIYYQFNYEGSNFYLSLNGLSKIDKDRFINTRKMNKTSKYYYLFYNNVQNIPPKFLNKYKVIKEIKVDGVVINAVYKIFIR